MVKHPVILRGYHAAANDKATAPLLIKRLDQEFVSGVLDGVRRGLAPEALGKLGSVEEDFRGGNLRLFQPVHRTFNLVLLETVCDRPGFPRLDPREIAGASFVVRRVRKAGDPAADAGWLIREDRIVGWGNVSDPKLDPDPAQRRPRLNAGHPHVNGKLARLYQALEPAAERVSPLFVAPPEVCAAAGRTLLYGLIPVTSAERSEEPQPIEVDSDLVRNLMPGFLRDLNYDVASNIGPEISIADLNTRVATKPKDALVEFVQELRLIHFGWRVFDSEEGAAIRSLLNEITLQFEDDERPLDDYLHELINRLVLRADDNQDPIAVPEVWPTPNAMLADKIREAVRQSLQARLREGVPNEQRFDEPDALYRLHSFIRVRSPDGCPPTLHWSTPSAPFGIAEWWESGGGPLHTISLPDLDRDSVKKIRPNVSFKVPPRLAEMLNTTKLQDLLDGNVTLPPDSGISLGWICSFSIPIITLCAFIVLNLFLVLLHLVFWWLFYIKICLPFPKPSSSSPP